LKDHIPQEEQVEAPVEALDRAPLGLMVSWLTSTGSKILKLCQKHPMGKKEIVASLGYKSFSGHIKRALKKLKEVGAITYTIPDKPNSRNQRYVITSFGEKILKEQKWILLEKNVRGPRK
jgi:hypothetical protein